MERGSFKEYSEAAMVEKEELYEIEICFEELRMFLSMGAGRYFFRTEQAECKRNFQAAEGLYSKRNNIFRGKFMLISICD